MTERPTYERSTCCVPGCPRWSRRFPGEWLCGQHWKMVPRRLRSALHKVWRAPWPAEARARRRLVLQDGRLWHHAKRRVILKEAGL